MKEFSSKTYLKDVRDFELKIYCKNDEYCFTIKKILNIKSPFILNEMGHDIKLLDNNYYIIEYIPFNKNYFCRFFIDDNKEIKEIYYQFTKMQGIENSIPYYQKLNTAYVKTQFGEKIYSSNNTNISKEVLEIIKQDKLEFNLNYKKYLW
jgi:hypothetical protein